MRNVVPLLTVLPLDHKLVTDSIYFCVSSYITACLTAKWMETSSQRQKEYNPPGI